MKAIALVRASMAEIARQLAMAQRAACFEMRVVGAQIVDQRPQRLGVRRRLLPAGEERAAIGEGQGDAQVHADQRLGGQIVAQQDEHVLTAPRLVTAEQAGRATAQVRQRERNALVPFAFRARPVDREEVGEAAQSRPLRRAAQYSIRSATRFSNPRPVGW